MCVGWVRVCAWLAVMLAVACRPGSTHATSDGATGRDAGDSTLLTRAHAAAEPGAPLEQRASVLSMAEAVEALAVREGVGARAASLHTLAATVLERAFRTFGREQDGKEATLLFQKASTDLRIEGACSSAVRAALLAGETARDASVTYTELYRAERRATGVVASPSPDAGSDAARPPAVAVASACVARLDHEMGLLAAFRPPPRVLDAIDQGLEEEGALSGAPHGLHVASAAEPRIVKIEPIAGAEAARVVIVLSKTVRFHPGDIAVPGMGPPHTYVDLDGVTMGRAAVEYPMVGIVTRVRAEPTSTGARVTLDLDGQAYRKVFYLPEPYRVVIDIARHPPGALPATGRRRVDRIALDPGHGGWDPGAIGMGGLREKDVTLDIAQRVGKVLTREGLAVLLTRDDDRYVPLEERTARANSFGADLFVSIHCNAAENHIRHGIETYVLDTTKDEIASRVAARENATSQAATAELGSILASLRLADHAQHSTHLAELLQKSAMVSLRDRYRDVRDGGVHPAGFYVLVGARMPSVLFETSYISNPAEEARLDSDDYKQRLADAIVNAVRAYREGK
jgi:N-acetylmuramoyl-L-alanine amidase